MPTAIELMKELGTAFDKQRERADKFQELRTAQAKDPSDERHEAIRALREEIDFADTVVKFAQRSAEIAVLEEQFRAAGAGEGHGPAGGTQRGAQAEQRSLGEIYTSADGYKDFAKGLRGGSTGTYEAEYRALVTSTGFWAATHTDGPGLLRPTGQPTFMPLGQVGVSKLWLEDLIASTTTNLAIIPFWQERDFATNIQAAGTVLEGATKPEGAINFTAFDAVARKIAVNLTATTEMLSDAPTLQGYIDNYLRIAVARRREAQILSGNGTAPNLKGIKTYAGIQSQAAVTGDPFAAIGRGLGKIEAADTLAEPSFIVMNPVDYWTAQTTRNTAEFDAQGGATANSAPFGAPPSQLWGLPVVRTNGQAAGTAFIRSREGAMIFNREETNIRIADQHGTNFTENKVTIQAETRLALAVFYPEAFCNVALTAV